MKYSLTPTRMTIVIGAGIAAIIYFARDKIIGELPATGDIPLPGVGDSVYTRNDVRLALRAQAETAGFDPDWFDAIARHESRWKLDCVSPASASDEKYGGAHGPMQMLKTTAEALGYSIDAIKADPNTAGEAAAKYMKQGNPSTFDDACAYWNTGRKTAEQALSDIPSWTYNVVVQKDLDWVKENQPS